MTAQKYQITTQQGLRNAFWLYMKDAHPFYCRVSGRKQNDYPADLRMTWCDYVDSMERNGEISESLAQKATL